MLNGVQDRARLEVLGQVLYSEAGKWVEEL